MENYSYKSAEQSLASFLAGKHLLKASIISKFFNVLMSTHLDFNGTALD